MKIAILGLGNVGTNFLRILDESGKTLEDSCGTRIDLSFAADSRHIVAVEGGKRARELLKAKESGDISAHFRKVDLNEVLDSGIDVLVDMSAASKDGNREKEIYLAAFAKGIHVVTANKSPLALHWPEIVPVARSMGLRVLYESTVAGGVPLFNFVKYSCGPSEVRGFRGIVSLSANFIHKMMLEGKSFQEAVKVAQDMGVAEADYTDDTSGLDAARKCVILANALFGENLTLNDISYSGIPELDEREVKSHGQVMRLITEVWKKNGSVTLSTGFRRLETGDYLLTLGQSSLGYELSTDNNGILRVSSAEDGPRETASGVMNDVLILARESGSR